MKFSKVLVILVAFTAWLAIVASANANYIFTPSPITNTVTQGGSPATTSAVMHKNSADPCVKWATDGLLTTGAESWTSYSTSDHTAPDSEYYIQPEECSASNSTLTITNTPGSKSVGTYNTAVNFSKNGNPINNTAAVRMIVQNSSTSPNLSVSPTTLTMSKVSGGPEPQGASFTVTNTGSNTLNYTITDPTPPGFTYTRISGTNGTSTPGPIGGNNFDTWVVTPSQGSLGAGTYTADLTLACTLCTGSPKTVHMSYTISSGDGQAPSTPTGLTKTSSTQTTIGTSWNASTDNVGVTGYKVARDTVVVGTPTGTSFALTGLTCGTSYSVKVRAVDAAGNLSPYANPVTMATSSCSAGDTTAPSVPTNLHSTASAQITNTVGWTASTDNVGVTGYDTYLNGTPKGSNVSGTSYQYTGLTCGTSYTATVRARDAAGNASAQTAGTAISTDACTGGLPSRWAPAKLTTWYWQISTVPTNLTRPVAAYDVDGAENSAGATASTVSTLHANGHKTICYFSAGTWENWREDASSFPAAVQGSTVGGFPDEKWLDVRAISTLKPIMVARMTVCKNKGFDAVEPDNMDGYTNSPGFPMTATDQIAYNQMIAQEAHKLGLAVFLKNDIDQLAALQPSYDGAINEQCIEFSECGGYSTFLNANKPVLGAEYNAISAANCSAADTAGRMTARFNLDLDGTTFTPCWPSSQPIDLGGTTTAGP